MASGITTENPPDLAIKALWIAPLEVGRIISVLIFFFLCSPRLAHQQRIAMSPCENDTPINWKRNLIVAWLGCFLTGAAFSLVMPFLPLYVEQLGVTGHSALNMWSGIVFSITFLFSAIASPFWGGLADRKGRKLMLLRSALGMGIVMVLMGLAQNIWQFLILRALLGLLGGFVPNANALIATQVPRNKSGWALGTLSTGGVSGALLGPMAGGLLADSYGLRPVFFITASVLILCFFVTLFCIREKFQPVSKKEMLHMREVVTSLKNPKLVLSLFVTTLIIQVATGSIAPILTLYVRELAGNVSNVAFISGMIASVPGVAALLSAPRLGKLGDRIGPEKILITALIFSVLLLIPMSYVQTPLQLGILRFCSVPPMVHYSPPYRHCWFTTRATRSPGVSSAITNRFVILATLPDH